MKRIHLAGYVALCSLSLTLVGCSGSGTTATISGKVSYKGAPVAEGTITLLPVGRDGENPGKPVSASVREDGTFTAKEVVLGRTRILFEPVYKDTDKEFAPGKGPPPSPYEGLEPRDAEVDLQSGAELSIELESAKKRGPGSRS